MEQPRLLSIQVGSPRSFNGDSAGDHQSWTTAFFKHSVDGPLWLGAVNLEGDAQANLKTHGGVDKAVCVYPVEHYLFWERRLARKITVSGAFAENFTTKGTVEDDSCIGDVLRVGDAICQISQPRPPCWKLARCWQIADLAEQVERTGRTGWYLRVLEQGYVQPGAAIQLLERPQPQWTVARANAILYNGLREPSLVQALAACSPLAPSWRDYLLSKRS
jgi:MOSC domain-containing protein YiiM